ncbi:MAG TPA: hypothetical protein VIG99_31010 [Myxococcaceae bacterium]|jgi:hypothetical protein
MTYSKASTTSYQKGRIPAHPIPQTQIPEHGTGSGACSVCRFSAGQFQVQETLQPNLSFTSQRVLLQDAAGNGFAYDLSTQVFQSLKAQGQAVWALVQDPAIALPPQKVWLETTLKTGTVIDNVEIAP